MTSQINAAPIDADYPVAGQDNDTQGFRDNFSYIKNNFEFASEEITNLQNNTAKVNQNNNFNGKEVSNALLKNNGYALAGSIQANNDTVGVLSFSTGTYQVVRAGADITFTFGGFPSDAENLGNGSWMILEILGDGTPRTISFASTSDSEIKRSEGFPAPLVVTDPVNPVLIEINTRARAGASATAISRVVFLSYLGQYS